MDTIVNMKFNKGFLCAIAAGFLGFFFAIVGFLKTIMIIVFIVLGYFIGSYWETREKEDDKDQDKDKDKSNKEEK